MGWLSIAWKFKWKIHKFSWFCRWVEVISTCRFAFHQCIKHKDAAHSFFTFLAILFRFISLELSIWMRYLSRMHADFRRSRFFFPRKISFVVRQWWRAQFAFFMPNFFHSFRVNWIRHMKFNWIKIDQPKCNKKKREKNTHEFFLPVEKIFSSIFIFWSFSSSDKLFILLRLRQCNASLTRT